MKLMNALGVAAYYVFGFVVIYAVVFLIVGKDDYSGALRGGAIVNTAVVVGAILALRLIRRKIWHLPKPKRREYPLN